ncbi:MAG: RDD family protein [Gammaproteobacteria bacterium]|nr:RDD family protein [Gammaproteobacteria bacterium]
MRLFSSQSSPQYAGFWRRLLAFAIDYILLSAVLLPILLMIYGPGYIVWLSESNGLLDYYGLTDLILTKFLPLALIVFFWTRFGATPGKLLLDCKVVTTSDEGSISITTAIIRLFGYVISALPVYLGFIWMAFDKRKQGLHDKLAKTLVLHQPDDYAHMSLDELMAPFNKDFK